MILCELLFGIQRLASGTRAQALFVLDVATVGNDITDALAQSFTNPQAGNTIIAAAVSNTVSMITRLYAAGARHVLVVNSTDVGRTPLVRAAGAAASAGATALSTQFNIALAAQLPAVRSASVGLTLYLFDLGALTAEVFANPATFSFTNITNPCVIATAVPPSVCSSPDSFCFWDGFHPTAATGRLVSQRAIAALIR